MPNGWGNAASLGRAYAGAVGAGGRMLVSEPPGEASSPELSAEQERVLGMVMDGASVFFTGNAGTGVCIASDCCLPIVIPVHSSCLIRVRHQLLAYDMFWS